MKLKKVVHTDNMRFKNVICQNLKETFIKEESKENI